MHNPLCKSESTLAAAKPNSHFSPQRFSSIGDIPSEVWNVLVPDSDIHKSLLYWQAIEDTTSATTGELTYLLLHHEDGSPRAVCAFQYVHFDVDQVLDKISRYRFVAKGIVKLVVRPEHRLLVGGSVWLSGPHGRWAKGINAFQQVQQEAARFLMEEDKSIFATLLKDYEDSTDVKGFHRFEVDPVMVLDLRPFENLEAYTSGFRSKYRQRMRSAMKKSNDVVAWELDEDEIHQRDAELMALFYQVVSDDLFFLSIPPTGYLAALKKSLGEAFSITGYFLKDRLIGFRASLHYEGDTIAYMVGFSREHNRDYKLYQRMLYDYVQEALERGSKKLDMGRTALEIKSCLGAEPRQYFLHIRFRYPCLHNLIKPVFNRLGPTKWEPRNPFATK